MKKNPIAVVAASLFAIAASNAHAADAVTAVTADAANTQVADAAPSTDELDQRIRVLERQLELQQEAADAKAKDAGSVVASDKGFSFKSAKGDYEIKFGALVQADARWYPSEVQAASGPVDTFLFRRVEPSIQGSIGKLVSFRITPQLANGSAFDTTDIYADIKFDPAATLRVGKFKESVGLENLQSSAATTFAERGLPTNLVPNRDLGVQLSGEFANATTNYAVGVFNGAPDRADGSSPSDVNDSKEFAVRIFSEPFKNTPNALQGLGVGIAATYANDAFNPVGNAATPLASYRSPGQLAIFTYESGTAPSGNHVRIAPQVSYYLNSLGVLAEYVQSRQEITRATNAKNLVNDAWQIATNYVLTGEDASYKGVKPKSPFKIGEDGWGAFDVGVRYGQLNLDNHAFIGATASRLADPTKQVSKASSIGTALNWYLNNNTKFALNYEHTNFKGGAAVGSSTTVKARPAEDVVIGRVQLAF